MKANGLYHILATIRMARIEYVGVWATEPVWTFRHEINLLPLLGFEPWIIQPIA